MKHNSTDYVHTLTEAMKLALANRDAFYANPLLADVPLARAPLRGVCWRAGPAARDAKSASLELRPGDPRGGKSLLGIAPQDYRVPGGPVHDTTTCVVANPWATWSWPRPAAGAE